MNDRQYTKYNPTAAVLLDDLSSSDKVKELAQDFDVEVTPHLEKSPPSHTSEKSNASRSYEVSIVKGTFCMISPLSRAAMRR